MLYEEDRQKPCVTSVNNKAPTQDDCSNHRTLDIILYKLSTTHFSIIIMPAMTQQQSFFVLIFGTTFILAATYVGFVWWDRGAPPGFKPTIVDVTIDTINREHRGVRIHGMARHDLKIRLKNKNSDKISYVYPLLPMDKMNSTMIKVMIRTTVPPDSMATIEERKIEGLARPPGRTINGDIIRSWQDRGYDFDEKFVLVDEFED